MKLQLISLHLANDFFISLKSHEYLYNYDVLFLNPAQITSLDMPQESVQVLLDVIC